MGKNAIALARGNGILSSNIAVWDNDKYPWRNYMLSTTNSSYMLSTTNKSRIFLRSVPNFPLAAFHSLASFCGKRQRPLGSLFEG